MNKVIHGVAGLILIIGAVFLVVHGVCYHCFGEHSTYYIEKFIGLPGIVLLGCTFLIEVVYGLCVCFHKIAKWARIDLWGHFVPMLLFVSTVSVGVLFTFAILVRWKYPVLQNRGAFGDSFGALNTLFSTAAFMTLLVSIAMQRRQMIDDRERNRIEQEQKRRSNWPAIVVSKSAGSVHFSGVTKTGCPTIRVRFQLVVKNVSNCPIMNVFPSLLFEKFSVDGDFSEVKTDGAICLEAGSDKLFEFTIVGRISDLRKMVLDLTSGRGRRLVVRTVFATAQQLYYCAIQDFNYTVISAKYFSEQADVFQKWMHQSDGGQCGEYKGRKYELDYFPHELKFVSLPLTCKLKEILPDEFRELVGDGLAN